ncbi:MAG: biopolymer transporter ExbD [Pirellulaceae bacterium]
MKIPTQLKPGQSGFNMTPMIDVVFLLIIFFLVSSHLAKQEAQMPLPLPTAESGTEIVDELRETVVVNVDREGRLLLAGREVAADSLARRLGEIAAGSSERMEVRIRCDRQTPYAAVRPIMLACTKAGIWNVVFAVIRAEDAES